MNPIIGPKSAFPLTGFPLYRAHVVPKHSGWLCTSLEDDLDFDISLLRVNQLIGSKTVSVPLLEATVRGSRAALTKHLSKPPRSAQLWQNVVPSERLPHIWRWIWTRFRNKKVSDFFGSYSTKHYLWAIHFGDLQIMSTARSVRILLKHTSISFMSARHQLHFGNGSHEFGIRFVVKQSTTHSIIGFFGPTCNAYVNQLGPSG
jgi:hypothetical protein